MQQTVASKNIELLRFLLLLHTFWTTVKIDCHEYYLEEITSYEVTLNLFYDYGKTYFH